MTAESDRGEDVEEAGGALPTASAACDGGTEDDTELVRETLSHDGEIRTSGDAGSS